MVENKLVENPTDSGTTKEKELFSRRAFVQKGLKNDGDFCCRHLLFEGIRQSGLCRTTPGKRLWPRPCEA